ncbi:lytic transglycosylase domain-containing protein [Achromobacter xylosoxidans]
MLKSSMAFKRLARVPLILLLALGGPAKAHADCWASAGERHRIDPLLLLAIAKVESSMNPKAINWNKNGTCDLGLMQINSANFPVLAAQGFDREKLIDACASIEAGAIMLSGFIKKHGYTWTAVGAYNAGSSPSRAAARKAYATKVWNVYKEVHMNPEKHRQLLEKWRSMR